jgi:hypothetical protein
LAVRVIASMTTIPSRIDLIRPAIESALNQIVPVERLDINIPFWCRRTAQAYVIPQWMKAMERVLIFRTEDYGPLTKVAPTFLRYRGDGHSYIWSVDDDCAYPPNHLGLLCAAHDPGKHRIIARHGGNLQPDGSVQYLFGSMEVSLFEGFGSVLYPPDCVAADFDKFLKAASANEECRKNDDVLMSLYFAKHGLPIWLHNQPSEKQPWMHEGWLPHHSLDANRNVPGFLAANKHMIDFVEEYFK